MHTAVELRESQGEVLLWTGAPDPKRLFSPADIFLVPFSLFWVTMGFLIIGQWPVNARPVGLLVICIAGLYLVVGRFLTKVHRYRRTEYVLTNQRAVIVGPRRTTSFDLTTRSPHVEEAAHGQYRTYRFTSDDPRTYGKIRYQLFENTGLDFALKPGHDIRFAFFDVRTDDQADSAIRRLIEAKVLEAGVA